MLIDIARDLIEYFITNYPKLAGEVIERWYRQKTVILKRLSVYGMTIYKGVSATDKLVWLLSKKELLNPTMTHENFVLINEIYSELNTVEKKQLFLAAERQSDKGYALYNFFVWINKTNPDCKLAKIKLNLLQQKNPEYGPREDPDLSSHMSSRWGHISPITSEDLIKQNLADSVYLLDTYKGEGSFSKPEREGLIDTLGYTVKENFDWSFKLAVSLVNQAIWHSDVWGRIIWSWNEVEELNIHNANKVVRFILNNKTLHAHHYEIARFVSNQDSKLYKSGKNEKCSIELLNCIRNIAFLDQEEDATIVTDEVPDWWGNAINSTGYYICYYFVRLFDNKYKNNKNKVEKLNEYFRSFITHDSYNAQMGKITLSHYLSFFFSVEQQWTREYILPMFDWTVDNTSALQSWQSYLYRGHWSTELFDDLIALHKKAFVHFKGLGQMRDNYCQQVSGLTLTV